jgi:hypothetical protein
MPPALLALIACSIVLTACASGTPTTNGAAQAHAGAVPSFSGPWAADFTSAYRSASSDFERKALADGSISDSEFAEMENRFKTCLTSHQMTFSGFKPGGGYDFHFGGGNSGAANQAADKCSASSGLNTVGSLYFGMLRNPQKLDEATIVAACLVKKGAVPAGYSASDYARDTPTESYPFSNKTTGDKSLDECTSDPLDLLSENQ